MMHKCYRIPFLILILTLTLTSCSEDPDPITGGLFNLACGGEWTSSITAEFYESQSDFANRENSVLAITMSADVPWDISSLTKDQTYWVYYSTNTGLSNWQDGLASQGNFTYTNSTVQVSNGTTLSEVESLVVGEWEMFQLLVNNQIINEENEAVACLFDDMVTITTSYELIIEDGSETCDGSDTYGTYTWLETSGCTANIDAITPLAEESDFIEEGDDQRFISITTDQNPTLTLAFFEADGITSVLNFERVN